MDEAPAVGTWVRAVGLVVDRPRHPDDATLRLESHNEDYIVHVRLDRLEAADRPDWASRCTDMFEFKPERFLRCQEHHDHGGDHKSGDHSWADAGTDGYFEEAT